MPETSGSRADGPAPKGGGAAAPPRLTARNVAFLLFGLMLAAGFVFWVGWCLAFHVCVDNGVYAVFVTLAGFGLAGMWVTLPAKPRPAP